MPEKSRRTFLAAAGVAGVAGLAGCSGDSGGPGTNNSTSTRPPTTSSGTSTGGTTSGEGTTETSQTTTSQSVENPGDRGTVVESFENVKNWVKLDQFGSFEQASEDKYEGKPTLRMKYGESARYVGIRKAAGQGGMDFSGKNLSIAVKGINPRNWKLTLELYAPDRGHPIEMTRILVGPTNRWTRVDFGVTSTQRGPDLSNVQEIRIVGRPRSDAASTSGEFLISDLRAVDRPQKGKVLLTFDDGRVSAYTEAFSRMKEYGFPGVCGIITEAIYNEGYLEMAQMKEMRDAGWDMAAHPYVGSSPMPSFSKREQRRRMKRAKDFLRVNGFREGMKHFIVPNNVMGPNTYDLAEELFESAFRFGYAPNGLPTTDPHNYSRINGEAIGAAKTVVDYAEKYNQATALMFHRIGGEQGLDTAKFEGLLEYIDNKNVEVVNATQLLKSQNLM